MECNFTDDDANVELKGEFTFQSHPTFRMVTSRLLACSHRSIGIDLRDVKFIDSAGLGMLLIAREESGKAGRKLTLRHPAGQVKRMFAISKFETLFEIET